MEYWPSDRYPIIPDAMRKLITICLFTGVFSSVSGQVIQGTVLDKNTRAPVEFAMLYFNGTFVGTYSDEEGKFKLDVTPHASMPLTVSAINYYSATVTGFTAGKPIVVYLIPKVYELEEIVVTAKSHSMQRKANLRIFREEFLGTTDNAADCEVLNEGDITFNYDRDRDTLKAFASKPIFIRNKALGYTITYYLDQFEYYRRTQSFIFKGNIIFTEDLTSDDARKQAYERKRKQAYLGSRMHFFRTLWANDLKSTGFVIRNTSGENLNYNSLVSGSEGSRKYLRYPENLDICYYSKEPTSRIVFLKPSVFFEKNGYSDPAGISWEGEMVKSRVADWLPYEYNP